MKKSGYYFEKLFALSDECEADVRETLLGMPNHEVELTFPVQVEYDQGREGELLKVAVADNGLKGYIRDEEGYEEWWLDIMWSEFDCIFRVHDSIADHEYKFSLPNCNVPRK